MKVEYTFQCKWIIHSVNTAIGISESLVQVISYTLSLDSVGRSSQADYLTRNAAMDDSIGGS